MAIRWDTLLARHTARELDRVLDGARLRAVRLDRDARELTLIFRERTLVWHLHPTAGHVMLHPPVEPGATDHRFRATLRSVDTPPDERVVRLHFTAARLGPVTVVVELMTTQWNAFVTEGEDGTIRHLLWRPANDERRVIGQGYRLPEPTGRRGADGGLSEEEWTAVLGDVAPPERAKVLVRRIAWTSPLNAPSVLGSAGSEDDAPDAADLAAAYTRWTGLADPQAPTEPVLLELDRGPQPYPFPLPGYPTRAVESLMDAFRECAAEDDDLDDSALSVVLGPKLLARLEARVDQAARRVSSVEAQLANLESPEELRAVGDLILARYKEVPPGAEVAQLVGFDGEPIEVRLDPSAPAHANASAYYDRAAKAERAAERLPQILDKARGDLERLEALAERVREGSATEEDVEAAVGPATPTRPGEPQGPSLPYRTFRSSGGLEIRVGRGARFNDDLTFHHSSPNDVWLHARHTAGAHVILRWQGPGNPPARDLGQAANLAALHSKARTSGSVPVDWTLRKYVRKPRKSPPGQVAIEREQTVFVAPDDRLLDRLADGR